MNRNEKKIDVVWDMETADPDDFITLLLLIGHPEVNLKAVTVTPGSKAQIGLVRSALSRFGLDIPVGANNIDHPKDCVSGWHDAFWGKVGVSTEAEPGAEVMLRECDANTVLITGAPLKNLGGAIRLAQERGVDFSLGKHFCQGGFAGANLVPEEKRLKMFKDWETCPTYNFNGDPKSALLALYCPGIKQRFFVSKNVCHGVFYDQEMHQALGLVKEGSLSLQLIWEGLGRRLEKRPEGKKMHDPLAACCAINPSIGTWREVEIYRERDEWGARAKEGTGTWIIVDYDHEQFLSTFFKK